MGQESSLCVANSSDSGSFTRLWSGVSQDCSHLSIWGGRICPQPRLHVIGRIQFLVGGWSKSLSFSLAVGQKPPWVPCYIHGSFHKEAYKRAAGFNKSGKWEKPGRGHHFYILSSEMTSHHFCYIFFIRSKSLTWSSPHSRKGITQQHDYPEMGITEDHFRSFLPQTAFVLWPIRHTLEEDQLLGYRE